MQGYREQWRVRSRDGEIKGLRERGRDGETKGAMERCRDLWIERCWDGASDGAMSDIGMEGAMDRSIEGWRDKGIAGAMHRCRYVGIEGGSDGVMLGLRDVGSAVGI